MLKNTYTQKTIFMILGNYVLNVYLPAFQTAPSLLKSAICGTLSYFRMASEHSLRSIQYAMATQNNTWNMKYKILKMF